MMSRDTRIGSVYSSDLYLRSWQLGRETSHRDLGLPDSPSVQQKEAHHQDFRHPTDKSLCVSIRYVQFSAWNLDVFNYMLRKFVATVLHKS
jgi:hypothetical protein